ncbi:hypothetical protein PR048_001873 [Dryococelus australis]|uniref:Uncharacterized protein n=1 Tax=Dryococelus australis TaxID=614101 RepID=A0ABQ9IJY2_9NEOP|nr:hypothetical protein PR048_001873 [Dryococelus australis]
MPDTCKTKITGHFNVVMDKNKYDIYLSGLIGIATIERHRPKTRNTQNQAYVDETVCKKAFCSLHGVGEASIEQNRDNHNNRPKKKTPEDVAQTIDDHINIFPKQSSHCSREINEKK